VDPANSIRTGAAGRLQALLFAIYPVTFVPILLAYLARYAFDSQAALYGILGLDAMVGLIVYWLALNSAVRTADLTRESMIAALSTGDGPISS
jgi:ABC-2 type transport system permease protein